MSLKKTHRTNTNTEAPKGNLMNKKKGGGGDDGGGGDGVEGGGGGGAVIRKIKLRHQKYNKTKRRDAK